VTLGGTASGTLTCTVSGSGTTYNVAVSGMTGSGTVTASLAAGVAHDASGDPNTSSASTDNSVDYIKPQSFSGTSGNDVFQVVAGATPDTWTFKLNGVALARDPQTLGVSLNGLGGNDSLTIAGLSGNDTFEIWPDHLQSGGMIIGFTNIEAVTVNGGSGTDSVVFHDSTGNDSFQAGPGSATLTVAGTTLAANSFENVQAYATSGNDTAVLFDSLVGSSTFTAGPDGVTFVGTGINNQVIGFGNVQAYATPGMNGTATFTGTAGADTFVASWLGAQFYGAGYDYEAWNFTDIQGSAGSGGADLARFYGSPGGNTALTLTAASATQIETNLSLKGTGFGDFASYVYPTGNTSATITGTTGVEKAVTSPSGVQMFGTNLALSAWNYHHVTMNGGGGADLANMYCSTGADSFVGTGATATLTSGTVDRTLNNFSQVFAHGNASSSAVFNAKTGLTNTFDASPTQASMSGTGYLNTALGFGSNAGYGVVGGTDVVTYEDSSGNDFFISSYLGSQMFGSGFNNSAWNFAEMTATSTGGADVARFYGSPSSPDSFVATPTDAQHSGTGFHSEAKNFARVEAYSGAGSGGTAQLTGSPGDDNFVGSPLGTQLWGTNYRLEAWNYASVEADGNGGADVANLYGASTNNNLTADAVFTQFANSSFSNKVTNFATVRVHGSASGVDSALLDSALVEKGLHDSPTFPPAGITVTQKLWLYDFDDVSTTKKPTQTTPQPQAVDQLMSAFMYE
jgi:hypothetical protein